jgi:hypothetical protein
MDLTRRTVLLAGLAVASVAVGTAATEGTFAAHSRELPLPPLDGELRFDKASRIAAADDCGHIVHRTPKGVLLPGSDQDVAKAIRDLRTLLTDEWLLAADNRFDAVQGAVLLTPTGWTYRLDAVAQFSGNNPPDDNALLAGLSDDRPAAQVSTLPYFDDLNRFAALEQLLRSKGQWFYPHPWLTAFIGDANIESVVSGETGGGWGGKNATTAHCVPNLHASKSHGYPQHTGSSDSHPGLIER